MKMFKAIGNAVVSICNAVGELGSAAETGAKAIHNGTKYIEVITSDMVKEQQLEGAAERKQLEQRLEELGLTEPKEQE